MLTEGGFHKSSDAENRWAIPAEAWVALNIYEGAG
jgi:hypothetical protein